MIFEITLCFILLLLLKLYCKGNHSNEPPGPKPWPILGNLYHLASASSNPTLAIAHFSKTYGNIYSLRTGCQRIVVISSKPVLDKLLSRPEALGRDRRGILHDRTFGGKPLGISLNTGKTWEKTRSFAFRTLKYHGFGKTNSLELHIEEEMQYLFSRIGNSSIMEIGSLFGLHLMSISYQIVSCRALSFEDKENIKLLHEANDELLNASNVLGMGLGNAFPFIRHLFPKISGSFAQRKSAQANNAFSKKLLEEALFRCKADDNGMATDSIELTFAEAFAKKMIEEGNQNDTIFIMENFQLMLDDILLGSSDTTNSYLQGIILFLVLHPHVQEKLHEEIKSIGSDIEFSHLKRMPFTQAVMQESHRLINVLPNLIPHKATEDFMFEGYLIIRNTLILPDMYTISTNDIVWTKPLQFNPYRFIDSDGNYKNSKNLLPFGTGPRKCPGELHGTITAFLFLTKLIQKYHVSIPIGDREPRSDMKPGPSSKPYTFRVQLRMRKDFPEY